MLQKVKIIIFVLLIAFLILGWFKYFTLYNQVQRSYDEARVLCDSIKSEKESVIDSLYLEIDKKESLIDSLFSNRDTVIIQREIIKEKIKQLPLNESVILLEEYLNREIL